MTTEQAAQKAEFDRLINMSAEEMTAHYATVESDYASLPHALAKRLKQTSGKQLGKEALTLKTKDVWTENDFAKAGECTRGIKRFLGRKVAYQTAEGAWTPFAIALLNRGHNPTKGVNVIPETGTQGAAQSGAAASEAELSDEQRRALISQAVKDALRDMMGGEFPEDQGWPWVRDVFSQSQYCIVEWMGALFRIPFALSGTDVVPDTANITEVTMEYVPVESPDDVPAGTVLEVAEAKTGEGPKWLGVMIRAGKAKNKAPNGQQRDYTAEALKAAVEAGKFDNVVGYDRTDAEHGKRAEAEPAGTWGKAVWNEAMQWVENTWTWAEGKISKAINGTVAKAVSEGKTDAVPGFSVVVDILVPKQQPHIVAEIEKVVSCDPVVSPSAGGVVLKVTESHTPKEFKTMKATDVLKAKGITVPAKLAAEYDKIHVQEGAAAGFMLAQLKAKKAKMFEKDTTLEGKLLKDEALLVTMFEALMEAEGVEPAPVEPAKTESGTGPAAATEAQKRIIQQAEEAVARMNAFALEGMLTQSGLPKPAQDIVRKRLEGKPFDAQKVTEAITETKDFLHEVNKAAAPHLHLSAGADQADKIGTAWADIFMMDVKDSTVRVAASESYGSQVKISNTSGGEIRSLRRLTEMTIGRPIDWQDRQQVSEALDTVIAGRSLVNGMNLRLGYRWDLATEFTHYRLISNMVTLADMKTKTVLSPGSLSDWAAKHATNGFPTLTDQGAQYATYTPAEIGGILYVGWKDLVNDEIGAVQQIPDRHYDAAMLYENSVIWGLVSTTAVLTGSDTAAVFSAARGNLINNALDAEGTGLEAAIDALQSIGRPGATDSNGDAKVVPLLTAPGFLWTSARISQRKAARNLVTPGYGQVNSIATFSQAFGIQPIVNPLATDANDWGVFGSDPRKIIERGYYGSDRPTIVIADQPGQGRRFTHNEIGFKGELEMAAAWATYRAAVYSQVAG